MKNHHQKLRPALEFLAKNLAEWSRENEWPIHNKGKKGVYELLIYLGRLQISSATFYRAVNEHQPPTSHTQEVLEAIETVIHDQGGEYDHWERRYLRATESNNRHLFYLTGEKIQEVIAQTEQKFSVVQTYLDNLVYLRGSIAQAAKRGVEIEIYLADPNHNWSHIRNQPPHPFGRVNIPERIKEDLAVLSDLWLEMGRPENFKIFLYPMPVPVCIYASDSDYYAAPFWAHRFATESLFQRFRYPIHPFAELIFQEFQLVRSNSIHHLAA